MHYFVKDRHGNEYCFRTLLEVEMYIINDISAMEFGYNHYRVGFNTTERIVYPTIPSLSYYTESGAHRNVTIYGEKVSIDNYWDMRHIVLDMMQEFKNAMLSHYNLL